MNLIVDQIANAVAEGDFGRVEDLWLELLEADPIPAEALAGPLAQLAERGEGARAVDLVLALAPDLVRAERHAEALPLLRAVAPAAEGDEDVRANLIDCYRRLYGDRPHLGACLDSSGLLSQSALSDAIATLDKLLSYEMGDFVYHASGWGVGQIVGFDALAATATVDFERKPGHSVPLQTLETIFTPLADNDFRVLRQTDPDRLRQLAQDDPAALVRMVIAAHNGRITQRTLRDRLTEAVVPAETWTRWWTTARAALTRDPLVALAKGANAVLSLRAEALTYEAEMRARFEQLKDLPLFTNLLREYIGHRSTDADPQAFLEPAAQAVAARIAAEASPGAAFEAAVLLDKIPADAGSYPRPDELIAAQIDPIPLLDGLSTNEGRRKAFELLRAKAANWPALCRRILIDGPKELWDPAIAELAPTGEPPSVQSLTDEIFDKPDNQLQLFAWLCRGLLAGRWNVQVTPGHIFDLLLTEGDKLARAKAGRRTTTTPFADEELLAAVRQALRTGDLAYFAQIIEQASEAEAARLLFRIRQGSILGPTLSRTFQQTIFRRYPHLLVEEEKPVAASDYIYATPEGIQRRREEHRRLVEVLIPENQKAIGRAADQGDISDNADWRAAIEERDRLTALAGQMTEELQRARPIEPAMVNPEAVSIGSRVTVENTDTGEQATYDLLGMWDSDDEHGVIAYVAPLAQALLRHTIGEAVTFDHAGQKLDYRILRIESALEARQANA